MGLSKIEPRQLNVASDLYLVRSPFINPAMYIPGLLDTARWRLVAAEPINKLARRMIQREVSSLNWNIRINPKGFDNSGINFEQAKNYYQDAIKDFRNLASKALKGVCELPQGGAWEVGWIKPAIFGEGDRGTLSFIEHIDAGTLHPTTSKDWPIVQIDPLATLRRVLFSSEEVLRILASPYDEFDKEWWQESPTMASYMAIEALSRIYIYYLKQLHDTPVAGILDLMDFSENDARSWAKSFREMLEGIDPVKIPILYQHSQPAKWLPMGRNPAELSIPQQFKQYAEIVLGNYGLSTSDLRIFEAADQSKAGAAVSRKITTQSGISFWAELIKDSIQALLPKYLLFEYDDPDVEEERTKAMVRASDARTIQTLPWLPTDYKAKLAQYYGLFGDLDIDIDKLTEESERLLGMNPGVQGIPTPAPGQLFQGEGKVPNQLEEDARANAKTSSRLFGKSESENDADLDIHSLVQKAIDNFKENFGNPSESKYGIKTKDAAIELETALRKSFKHVAKNITPEFVSNIVTAIYTQFPSLNVVRMDSKKSYSYDEQIPTNFIEKADGDPTNPEPLSAISDETLQEIRANVDQLVDYILGLGNAAQNYTISSSDLLEVFVLVYRLAFEDGMLATAEMIQNDLYGRGIVAAPGVILSFDVTNDAVIQILNEMAAELVRNIDDGTKYYLRRMIVEGALNGWSVDRITEAIWNDLFGLSEEQAATLSESRIRSIVTTELNRADSAGRLEEMKKLGLKLKRWITRLIDVCTLCASNESYGSVPIDFEYMDVFGPTQHPPGHPTTCHCTLGADPDELEKIGSEPDYWTGD